MVNLQEYRSFEHCCGLLADALLPLFKKNPLNTSILPLSVMLIIASDFFSFSIFCTQNGKYVCTATTFARQLRLHGNYVCSFLEMSSAYKCFYLKKKLLYVANYVLFLKVSMWFQIFYSLIYIGSYKCYWIF